MRTVAIVANKGGTGKTSLTLGLAGAAAHRGLAVLVIDLDPQGNATSHLRSTKGRTSAVDIFAHPTQATFESAIAVCNWDAALGEVDVVPSHPDLIRFDSWNGAMSNPKLARAMKGVVGYDLVLVDCPPSLGALTREALAAADRALVVTTPSYFGAQGVERALAEIREIQRSVNPDLELCGVVMNKFKPISEEHAFRAAEMNDIAGSRMVLKPYMPDRIAFQQAEGTGAPVQAISNSGAREVSEILDTYLTKILR